MTGSRGQPLPSIVLGQVEEVLRATCGFRLPECIRSSLELGLRRAASAAGKELDDFIKSILASEPASVRLLVEYSVIGETYFSRFTEHYDALKASILPRFPANEPLRLWSAGCATGEEAYRIAMALLEAGRAKESLVYGTDISERALARAREGIYSQWSLRRLEPQLRPWMVPDGKDQVRVTQEVRELVSFRHLNLLTDPPPAYDLHIVFCRNVLIYFGPEDAARVLRKLESSLRPGGFLLLGVAELPMAATTGLQWLDQDGVTLLRRPLPGERYGGAPTWAEARERNRLVPGQAPPPFAVPSALPAPLPLSTPLSRPEGAPNVLDVSPRSEAEAPTPAARTSPQRATRGGKAKAAQKERAGSPRASEPSPAAPAENPNALTAADRDCMALAREALTGGDVAKAERLARELVSTRMVPEGFLLLAMTRESQGDLQGAVWAVGRALYLEPDLPMGHAMLMALYRQLGDAEAAERARQNTLRILSELDDQVMVAGVEQMSVGALRRALGENS